MTTDNKPVPVAENVLRFMQACDHLQNPQTFHLYMSLIKEEYGETEEAYHSRRNDLNETDALTMMDATIDGLLDLIWVAMGALHATGIDVDRVWAEVSRANLSKIDKDTGFVKRRNDGKVLKPHDWRGPDNRIPLLQALADQETLPHHYLTEPLLDWEK